MNKKKKIPLVKKPKLKLFRFSLRPTIENGYRVQLRYIRAASLYDAFDRLTLDEMKRLMQWGTGSTLGFQSIYNQMLRSDAEKLAAKFAPKGFVHGYKKVFGAKIDGSGWLGVDRNQVRVLKLAIPADAKRVYIPWGNSECKMRASEALVSVNNPVGISGYDNSFVYVPGQTVKPRNNFGTSLHVCDDGIHFYLTEEQAEKHLI